MKKLMGLFVSGLAFTLFAPMASAAFVPCQQVNSSTNYANYNGTLTCTVSFTVPNGQTLTAIELQTYMDASGPANTGTTVTTTFSGWTFGTFTASQAGSEALTNSAASSITFGTCSASGGTMNPLPNYPTCPSTTIYNLGTSIPQNTLITTTVTVNFALSSSTGGAAGSDVGLQIQYDYVPNGTVPEPVTLGLTGAGLLGLGLFAKKRNSRSN